MSSNTNDGQVIRVSSKGQATIPKALRERFDIETPGKVRIHEENGKIVVEPVPSVEAMQGVHSGRYEDGEVSEHLRAMTESDNQRERADDERLDRQ
jgi:AbrB family looped-hinge helix DNA binding protein